MIKPTKERIKYHTINFRFFFQAFWKTILAWVILVTFVVIAIHFNVDKTLVGGVVVIFGIVSQAFVGLLNILGLIPFIGPLIAKVLALPFFWLVNGVGYFVSILAIKRGYTKEVVNYRILTIVLLIGIVIGFIIGKMI